MQRVRSTCLDLHPLQPSGCSLQQEEDVSPLRSVEKGLASDNRAYSKLLGKASDLDSKEAAVLNASKPRLWSTQPEQRAVVHVTLIKYQFR